MYIHYTSCTHSNITPLPLHDALPILTDAPIQRVWPILGEANDVRLRFDAGQPSAQASDGRADEDRAEPRRHPSIEPALEQIEGQRTWRDEEHEDPDRPVVETVVKLVALPDFPLGCVLDRDRQWRADSRVYPGCGRRGACPHMPRRKLRASASARFSSSRRASGTRAVTRAKPSRTSAALMKRPSSRNPYARRR